VNAGDNTAVVEDKNKNKNKAKAVRLMLATKQANVIKEQTYEAPGRDCFLTCTVCYHFRIGMGDVQNIVY